MAFSQSFSGKGTISPLPQANNAQEGLNKIVTQANELKYQTYKQNEAQFIKNSQIDPAFVLSDSARKYQMSLIDSFNKKWGKKAQETSYNLSTQDKQDMLTEKNLILAEADNQKAQMDLFQQHRDLVAKNPDKYDINKFAKATETYMKEGTYNQTMPPLKAIPFGNFIKSQASKVKGEYAPFETTMPSGQRAVGTYNIEDTGKFIEDNLFVNEQATVGLLEDWSNELPDVKNNFLVDTDKSGSIDPLEQKNGIVEWAKQKYAKDAQVVSYTGWKNPPSAGSRTTFDWNVGIGGGHNQNNKFETFPNRKVISAYGTTTFPDFMNLGQVSYSSDPQQIEEVIKFDDNGNQSREKLSDVSRLDIVGYSPATDIITVKALDDGETVSQGDILFLDASQYNDLLKRKPFGIDRESLISGNRPTTPVKKKLY